MNDRHLLDMLLSFSLYRRNLVILPDRLCSFASFKFLYILCCCLVYVRAVDEAKVRKAYFRMAQKYHPDKNPEGRVSVWKIMIGKSTSTLDFCAQ